NNKPHIKIKNIIKLIQHHKKLLFNHILTLNNKQQHTPKIQLFIKTNQKPIIIHHQQIKITKTTHLKILNQSNNKPLTNT
ncbi:hypothetical protein DF186_21940, partial [Enterococcus hirae]